MSNRATESRAMAELMNGQRSVEDMDDDELIQMRFKDKGGHFRGRPPKNIPRELAIAAQQELLKRGVKAMEENFLGAIGIMAHLMLNGEEESTRFKAAQYIYERVAGKTPDKVEINVDARWQVLLDSIIVPADEGKPAARAVIPGEVVS